MNKSSPMNKTSLSRAELDPWEGRTVRGPPGGERASATRFAIQQPCPGHETKGQSLPKSSPPHAEFGCTKSMPSTLLPCTAQRRKGHLEALASPRIPPKHKYILFACPWLQWGQLRPGRAKSHCHHPSLAASRWSLLTILIHAWFYFYFFLPANDH